ncbi:helix-turn-helix transcriptional regulator [Mucilaginibacter sp. 21P]|uniref:AraC family transcriptional regulator n=1 Tax=Mucilaginibacter sp. 21P TaxID=2778902 RepID=UPI001C57C4C1|nr:AraC family transcriptional regulator [Mucilaginibacter sp. 21P]QXV63947.1 helix-turn-helix transcriptional regulator [Mucilaginibacter sp. 21P]
MKSIYKEKDLILHGKVLRATPENKLTRIPDDMGTGYIKGYVISPKLRLLVRQYELIEGFVLDRGLSEEEANFVMIAFHNVYYAKADMKNKPLQPSVLGRSLPSLQVSTAGFNYEFFPANKKINSIVITVHKDYLKELLDLKTDNGLLETITSSDQSFLFEELISPQIQDVADEIVTADPAKELQNLYYKIKAEELIYLLFVELLKRQDTALQNLNVADVKKVYEVKDKILSNIDTPPILTELVKLSGMSESKLKRLFKQIFGNSIYNYYQSVRMKEAAYLLKEEKLAVSEVGYRLGFSNLSHFTRLFETHHGIKPKKFRGRMKSNI